METLTTRVQLVRTPDGQRLDIPASFALSGDEAVLRAEGNRLVVEPISQPQTATSLLSLLKTFETLEDWPEIEDPPPEDVRL